LSVETVRCNKEGKGPARGVALAKGPKGNGGQLEGGAPYDQEGMGVDFNGDTITNSNDTL
jgi:hypothetical protein